MISTHRTKSRFAFCAFTTLLSIYLSTTVVANQQQLAQTLQALTQAVPLHPLKFTKEQSYRVLVEAKKLEELVSKLVPSENLRQQKVDQKIVLRNVEILLQTQSKVNALFNKTFKLRSAYVSIPVNATRRNSVRQFIQTTARLRDLSGRMRFSSYELIDTASLLLSDQPKNLLSLIELLTKYDSSIGAAVMAEYLHDPEENAPNGLQPIPEKLKRGILKLIANTGQIELLEQVVLVVRSAHNSAELKLLGVETIRKIGLPQDPLNLNKNNEQLPTAEITAKVLYQLVEKLDTSNFSTQTLARHKAMLAWLNQRATRGIVEPYCQLGRYRVKPGDFMLMRNPSPYNLFTDLSPGLFSHVGVVAELKDSSGKRHLVIIDMPERGETIPAVNVERYVKRTLDYMFLRHHDENAARTMAKVAQTIVGNPAVFDLNFRTSRVTQLKGKSLQGRKISTYCAGLLLLCTQETKYKREDYFPLKETMAGGNTAVNLAKLGIKFGEQFVSPTGPLFSTKMSVAAQREPMYSPGREIEQAVYYRFANRLVTDRMEPSLNVYNELRLKLAEAAKNNPLLKQALAKAVSLDKDIDLVAAAKTSAVVETMDEIAYAQSDLYELADRAFNIIDYEPSELAAIKKNELKQLQKLQKLHANLFALWQNEKISPRQLRIELVKYYINQGESMIDERFYQAEKSTQKKDKPASLRDRIRRRRQQ